MWHALLHLYQAGAVVYSVPDPIGTDSALTTSTRRNFPRDSREFHRCFTVVLLGNGRFQPIVNT